MIPQTRYQQNLEKAEMMSNTKKNRNIYFAVITVAVVVFTLGGIGVLSAQESNASASASKKKTVKTANNVKAPKLAKETFSYISTAQEVLKDGRTFGPHGEGLWAANSISDYDEELSRELTELTKTANLRMRELGFKPYAAPAKFRASPSGACGSPDVSAP